MPTPKNCYNIYNLQKIIHDNLISSLFLIDSLWNCEMLCHRFAGNEKNQRCSEVFWRAMKILHFLSRLQQPVSHGKIPMSSNLKQYFGKILLSLPTTAFCS